MPQLTPEQREKTARTPRFVKNISSGHVLDEASSARARRLVGLKGYVTNIPAHLMPAAEINLRMAALRIRDAHVGDRLIPRSARSCPCSVRSARDQSKCGGNT